MVEGLGRNRENLGSVTAGFGCEYECLTSMIAKKASKPHYKRARIAQLVKKTWIRILRIADSSFTVDGVFSSMGL